MPRSRARKILLRLIRVLGCLVILGLAAVIVFTFHCRRRQPLFSPTPEALQHPDQAAGIPHYSRPEVDTFYTYPEWYIVWSYQSKADYQRNHLPSG